MVFGVTAHELYKAIDEWDKTQGDETAPSQQRFAIADQNGELLVALQNPPHP